MYDRKIKKKKLTNWSVHKRETERKKHSLCISWNMEVAAKNASTNKNTVMFEIQTNGLRINSHDTRETAVSPLSTIYIKKGQTEGFRKTA